MNTDDATALIHIVLGGGTLPAMKEAPSSIGMPPFGWRLNDRQTADVVTFIRTSWGNSGPGVSSEAIRAMREELQGMGSDLGKASIE